MQPAVVGGVLNDLRQELGPLVVGRVAARVVGHAADAAIEARFSARRSRPRWTQLVTVPSGRRQNTWGAAPQVGHVVLSGSASFANVGRVVLSAVADFMRAPYRGPRTRSGNVNRL